MKTVQANFDIPAMEREILNLWQDRKIFAKSNELRAGAKEYAFYDGPPFANGLPHYGHLLANTIKDCVPRYWSMRGFYVDRRFGWDCHGVPVEYEIEKQHKLGGHADVVAMGIGKFNELCRSSVRHYVAEWQKTITRLGRWVDWDRQYHTMDPEFMESVWWVFSELARKGLVYRDYKVVPYSPRIATVLSNFEANQNYKDLQDPAVTVKFPIVGKEREYLLAWTTTPWTLIANLGLCVGPEIVYCRVKELETNEIYWLAKDLLSTVFQSRLKKKKADEVYQVLEEKKGEQLVGWTYKPIFPYYASEPQAFRVLSDDFVSTSDGSGIVHMAPAFGEDDFRICKRAGLTLVDPIDESGRFAKIAGPYQGMYFKDADKEIIKDLKAAGLIFEHATIVHSYPFCERTDQPLMYKAIPAWYVSVESLKDKLVANNQQIRWVPEHLRDGRMGKWLENAKDWAVSRNRFWGTPLPIWVAREDDRHYQVIGSVRELEELTGKKVTDLHKHHIDDLTFVCPKTGFTMVRVSEVFDCWFESGAMPYAQLHYPFENQERFKQAFPADFIAEGLDQTRGWFYTLAVLSTALFDRPAFKNVIVNGIICDETGKKMSKRHRNYTPPGDLLEKYGSDSVRLYMLNSSILRGENLIFSDASVRDTTRMILLPLWNAYGFLSTYAKADGWQARVALTAGQVPTSTNQYDCWMVSRLHSLMQNLETEMEAYALYRVIPLMVQFVDDLTNTYIRLNRRRFWSASDASGHLTADGEAAYSTLFYVICEFTKLFAPFAPFISERIFRDMTDGLAACVESVHLCDMPRPDASRIDLALEKKMSLAQKTMELGRGIRAKHNLKTRQVLQSMLLVTRDAGDQASLVEFGDAIRQELNVKELKFSADEKSYVRLVLKPNLKVLGPKLGKNLGVIRQELERIAGSQEESFRLIDGMETGAKVQVGPEQLGLDDLFVTREVLSADAFATEAGVTVILDTKLSPELIREGIAREYVNRVQNQRKDSGLQVSDRIALKVTASSQDHINALKEHEEYLKSEVLAAKVEFAVGSGTGDGIDLEDSKAWIEVRKL